LDVGSGDGITDSIKCFTFGQHILDQGGVVDLATISEQWAVGDICHLFAFPVIIGDRGPLIYVGFKDVCDN
jgi:hypothetical protein